MRYIDASRPRDNRPCTVTATNADGTVNLQVNDPDGNFAVASVPVVPVGGTPATLGYFAQVEKTAAEVQAEQAATSNGTTLRQNIATVQAAHRAYIGLASPTAAQRKAWEDNVARNLIALNRFLLNDLTGTA